MARKKPARPTTSKAARKAQEEGRAETRLTPAGKVEDR